MPKEQEEFIVESKTTVITNEAKQFVENLLKFKNELPADVVKTLTLSKPKKKREQITVKKEEKW
jgi:hypothetical protein